MKEESKNNVPLMFIETLQVIKNKNKSQTYYDSRYQNKSKNTNT